jgi:hypothetical protein
MSTELRVQVARDLRAIVTLWRDLPEEAAYRADDKDMPGGDALVMLGPVANLEAWEHRYEAAESAGRDTRYVNDQQAELHPLLVLATWEDAIRDERDQPTDLRATVERAADYVGSSIDWMLATDENGDVNFLGIDQLSIDLRRCRASLENLLHDGDRAEWARVTCINDDCDEKPRLMKVYGDTAADDHHKCPACRARYDYDEFLRAAKVHAASEMADDAWVTVADAAHSISRPANTIRGWIAAEKLSTQRAPLKPSTTYVLWSDVRTADKDARVVEARRKANRIA